MVSIGILHKFNPSIFNSKAVIPYVSGTFWHLARSPAAPRIFARVHILAPRAVAYGNLLLRTSAHKKRQSMPTIHVLPPFYPIIYVIFSGHLPRILSFLRSSRYQSAERQKRQNIRNDHKPVKEVR